MKNYSILRSLQEENLERLKLTGRVIDLGGHKASRYYELIDSTEKIEVANYDAHAPAHNEGSGADHVFDLEHDFPLASATYDHVLCINVMEHIFNFHNLMSESARIIKPQGSMYLTVPFFFNVHGSPNDYFRYTRSTLERLFADNGFVDIQIVELGYGPLSAGFQNLGGSIPTSFLRMLIRRFCIVVDSLLSRVSGRYASINNRIPIGYFVSATKSAS